MNIIRDTDSDFEARVAAMTAASSLFDPVIEERTRAIVEAVQGRGDAAVLELTERFDGAKLTADQLPVSTAEFLTASIQADAPLRQAITMASRNIERFSRRSIRRSWRGRNGQGAEVGEKYDPFQRVGIYVPGGSAPLVSTALMTVVLARVAGCPEIVVCTPADRRGEVNPALIYALNKAGTNRIYRVGGAQAIAALAFGTATIPRVQKIFGPGNAYVVAAKRLLFGHVAVDLLPGPSEVLVIADETANPAFAASDLLAQAEHGSGHERVWLITTTGRLLEDVRREIEAQLPGLSRRECIERALQKNGWLIQVRNLEAAVALANRLAPEHCEIMTRQAERVAARIVTAGALFLGGSSPTVLGDYLAGPSHELPTGGAGACFAGLTVDQFQRRTSVVSYSRASLVKSAAAVQTFAKVEGLDAHGRSAAIRLEKSARRGPPKAKGSASRSRARS